MLTFTFDSNLLQRESKGKGMDLRCSKSCYSEMLLSINFLSLMLVCNQPLSKASSFQKHESTFVYPHFLTHMDVYCWRPKLKIIMNVYASEQKCHEVMQILIKNLLVNKYLTLDILSYCIFRRDEGRV